MAPKNEATPLTEEALLKRETDLQTQSEQLVKDQEDFQKSKVDFDKEKADFEKIRADFQTEKSEFETSQRNFDISKNSHRGSVVENDQEFTIRSAALDERENALNVNEAEIDAKIADLVERESALEDSKTEVKEEKPIKGLSFEIEKEKFKFLDTAPKTILFDGKPRTQKDLVKDDEALLQLSSNQSLIEKIN